MSADEPLVRPPEDVVQGTLAAFAQASWFADRERSSIWLRVHVLVGLSREALRERATRLHIDLELDAPVAFRASYLGDFKLIDFDQQFHADDRGVFVVRMEGRERQVPSAVYATLATPHDVDGASGNETVTRRRLDRASALLVLHMGPSVLRESVFDGVVNAASGQYTLTTDAFKNPQLADGPVFYGPDDSAIQEVTRTLRHLPTERQRRVELSLEFFERAIRGQEAFFELWTSLELLANGSAQAIRSRLQAAYQLRSVKEVDEGLGFATIARWRHDYFHKGIRPVMSADVERYIQLLYLDLLRSELGLHLHGYARGFQRSRGFDLSPIGLADTRTPEQLEAIRRNLARLSSETGNGASAAAV